jgi:hypothetical protein
MHSHIGEYALMKVHCFSSVRLALILMVVLAWVLPATAQTCFTADDMDAATRTALQNAAMRYFDMVARGDTVSLQQGSIPTVAGNFSGIENTVKEHQAELSGTRATARPAFLLKAEGTKPLERAEFLCGIFNGAEAAKSAEFVIPNLPPGTYGVVILDVPTSKSGYTLSLVLEQQGNDWRVGGFFLRPAQVAGHDSSWFLERARAFKAKGQTHNAWLYFFSGRELAMPVPFMFTLATDQLYDEEQSVRPSDFPIDGSIVELAGPNGKTYKWTAIFPLGEERTLDLVTKYLAADVSNSGQTFQENMTVMRAVLAKFPELREAFDVVVARAVEPSGRDYGSMMPMKDLK